MEHKAKVFDGVLLLSDLDGTLLDTQKSIPLVNLEAIRRFERLGGRFTIATGRCPRSARDIARAAGVNSPVVTLNGAVIYDYGADRIVDRFCLPQDYEQLVQRVHREFPDVGIQIYVGSHIYVAASSPVVERLFRLEHTEDCRIDTSPDRLPAQASKVLFGGPNARLQEVRRAVESAGCTGMYGMFTEDVYYEILPADVNKGRGALAVAGSCGIDAGCVAAVGDYYNDVDMLRMVDYPIVAGNAPDDVKLFARYITTDCDHGVVADAIAHLEQRLIRRGTLV